MLRCAICGKEFDDNNIKEYADHVSKCAASAIANKDEVRKYTEKIEKLQVELHKVKKEFSEKYPAEYKKAYEDTMSVDENKSKTITKKYSSKAALDESMEDFLKALLYIK